MTEEKEVQQMIEEDFAQYEIVWTQFYNDKETMEALFLMLINHYIDKVNGFAEGIEVLSAYQTIEQQVETCRKNISLLIERMKLFQQNNYSNDGLFDLYLEQERAKDTIITEMDFTAVRLSIGMMEEISSIEKEEVDLSYMLFQMADEFYPIFHAHGNTAELDVGEELMVMADSMELARVFNNILKNAVAYSYPNTAIKINAKEEGNHVQVSFSNEGKTIPKQKLDSVFEKFFRLDEARATNTGGAGLGLAIAKEIVSLHNGTISASSENGTTVFLVTLPLGTLPNQ